MKDQIRLLRDCFHNEIPAVVFQGNDSCAGEILEAAKKIYQKLIREEMRQKGMVY